MHHLLEGVLLPLDLICHCLHRGDPCGVYPAFVDTPRACYERCADNEVHPEMDLTEEQARQMVAAQASDTENASY